SGGRVLKGADLLEGGGAHVVALAQARVPIDDGLQSLGKPPGGVPAEVSASTRGVELELARLVWVGTFVVGDAQLIWPQLGHAPHYPADLPRVVVGGAEVPSAGKVGGIPQCLSEHEIAGERVEHVLPRANGIGVADVDGLAGERGAHDVGDAPVGGPVAAADHVAGAGGGEACAVGV